MRTLWLIQLSLPVAPFTSAQYEALLRAIERDLEKVCTHFNCEDTQALGGYGRLSMAMALSPGASEGGEGTCLTFIAPKEGVIALNVDYSLSTMVHEFTHWHDAKACWAAGMAPPGRAAT